MLHTETVSPETLELIKILQTDLIFSDFYLVGGTALSLQIGHRISVDIDFFSREVFDVRETLEYLEQQYGFQMQYTHKNTLKGIIDGVFIDIMRHDYKYVNEPIQIQGIKLATKEDIAAMKVNAITGNGTRVKDFIDVYFLLKEFSFSEIIRFYNIKYKNRNDFHAIKSMTYFDDIITQDWPNMVLEPDLTIEKVKKFIILKRDHYLKEQIKKSK